ncbi:MAG TPA: DUF4142 domain-containing protein [Ohtaekwangia sp.]|uniref:DUF4142 domain-containing protein n=1 Tax=Ohtaekwangia sp. TaxID=2066019 RepID=UPI002F95E0D0
MKTTLLFYSIALVLMMSACQQPKESKQIAEEKNKEKFENKADEKDAQFVVETTNMLHTLIALADVALEKNSPRAAATAHTVKPEFQNLLGEVESYATAHVISIPTEASERSTEQVRKLLDEKPSNFDTRWCKEIRDKNHDLIREMETYGTNTKDLNIKTWLNSALPQVRTVQDKLVDFENKLSKK